MDLYEYQARDLFEKYEVPVLAGIIADTPEEVRAAVNEVLTMNQRELSEHFDSTKKALEETKSLDRELAAADLSPQARTQKLKRREEQVAALHTSEAKQRQFKQTGDIRMRERLSRMRAGVVDEVNGIVAREARENDYAIVLDTSGTSTPGWPTVLYAREIFDFTDRVIRALQKQKGWEK